MARSNHSLQRNSSAEHCQPEQKCDFNIFCSDTKIKAGGGGLVVSGRGESNKKPGVLLVFTAIKH